MIEHIKFQGVVIDGRGTFVQLHVPGRSELTYAPTDWPIVLEKGSLNILIDADGFPTEFAVLGLPHTVKSLDLKNFQPTFEIPQAAFGNNRLLPNPQMPHRGAAQVWRARMSGQTKQIDCWALRRYGSGLSKELELVSACHLRSTHHLNNGMQVSVELEVRNAEGGRMSGC